MLRWKRKGEQGTLQMQTKEYRVYREFICRLQKYLRHIWNFLFVFSVSKFTSIANSKWKFERVNDLQF